MSSPACPSVTTPFRAATALASAGGGRFTAEIGEHFTVGPKAHGGLLMVLLAKAALERVAEETGGATPDPLAVAADFLRAPDQGRVLLHTDVLKTGRTASVVAVRMEQDGRPVLASTVTTGRLAAGEPRFADLPDLPPEPPADALDPAAGAGPASLAGSCDLRWDTATAAFVRREQAPPVVRGWVRPHGEPADVLFALLAGDILPPTVFNLGGGVGWAPTVQLTALMRARPAPGWLRVESRSTVVGGPWFDEDATVIDSSGRLVCQARQLALSPLAR